MSYNISLNFSSILANFPGSRFLTLLRKGVYESPVDALHPAATAVDELLTTESSLDVDTRVAAAIDKLTSTPGAWPSMGFFCIWIYVRVVTDGQSDSSSFPN
jgi:hypothetical protein